jgi:imidazoleglycerol-phosphate dehydratase
MDRSATVNRKTRETDIRVRWHIDGGGRAEIETGIPFFDHMLTLFAVHGFFDLAVNAEGDLDVDFHHTVEDVGICFGRAVRQALSDMTGVVRYGSAWVPMEESLVHCAMDICNRPYLAFDVDAGKQKVGEYDTELTEEFLRAVVVNAGITMHIRMIRGGNTHHIHEAVFKSFGRALGEAISRDPRIKGVHSTKGAL